MSRDVRATASIIPPQPVMPDVQLAMSGEVARTLLAVIQHIGGFMNESYRADMVKISDALYAVGVRVGAETRFSGTVIAKDAPK